MVCSCLNQLQSTPNLITTRTEKSNGRDRPGRQLWGRRFPLPTALAERREAIQPPAPAYVVVHGASKPGGVPWRAHSCVQRSQSCERASVQTLMFNEGSIAWGQLACAPPRPVKSNRWATLLNPPEKSLDIDKILVIARPTRSVF